MAVRVITDSTSDLPKELVESLGITVVPLRVHFEEEEFKDGIDLSVDEFYDRLLSGTVVPRTSEPTVEEFIAAYEDAATDADGIISVHVSRILSRTFESASDAKERVNVGCPIEILDTRQVSMGVGMVAVAAATCANNGDDLNEVAGQARYAADHCQTLALLDTVEYLKRGGRIGKAKALLGTLFGRKPIVIVRDGDVDQLGTEGTRLRGMERVLKLARSYAPFKQVAVMYSTTREEARMLGNGLSEVMSEDEHPVVARFGPVLGTYVGPRALGIGFVHSKEDGSDGE